MSFPPCTFPLPKVQEVRKDLNGSLTAHLLSTVAILVFHLLAVSLQPLRPSLFAVFVLLLPHQLRLSWPLLLLWISSLPFSSSLHPTSSYVLGTPAQLFLRSQLSYHECLPIPFP